MKLSCRSHCFIQLLLCCSSDYLSDLQWTHSGFIESYRDIIILLILINTKLWGETTTLILCFSLWHEGMHFTLFLDERTILRRTAWQGEITASWHTGCENPPENIRAEAHWGHFTTKHINRFDKECFSVVTRAAWCVCREKQCSEKSNSFSFLTRLPKVTMTLSWTHYENQESMLSKCHITGGDFIKSNLFPTEKSKFQPKGARGSLHLSSQSAVWCQNICICLGVTVALIKSAFIDHQRWLGPLFWSNHLVSLAYVTSCPHWRKYLPLSLIFYIRSQSCVQRS